MAPAGQNADQGLDGVFRRRFQRPGAILMAAIRVFNGS